MQSAMLDMYAIISRTAAISGRILAVRPRYEEVLGTVLLGGLILLAAACQSTDLQDLAPTATTAPNQQSMSASAALTSVPSVEISGEPPPTVTTFPTSTPRPTPSPTATPLPTPTATPIPDCKERLPNNGLTALVTKDYGISREYVPPGLVSLSNYLPITVTLGYPTEIREVAAEPLVEMIVAMHEDSLRPTIISGYRSYAAQSIAWTKWQTEHPDRASIISAPPGHSEHQLGTTVDFGSPELGTLVGDEDIEFHTNFYMTAEGQWLAEYAHEYGFILSFPRETFELTGMYYEPWHYRYVGRELASQLAGEGVSLISLLLETEPPPCVP